MLSRARPLFGRHASRVRVAAFHASSPARAEDEAATPTAEESEGFFNASLGDFNRAVPLGALLAVPFIANNWYIMNEETQIMGCFMLFTGTMYSLVGDAVGEFFDEDGKAIMAEHNAIEDANIAAVDAVKEAHIIQTTANEDIAAIGAAAIALQAEMASAKTLQLKHEMRNKFVAKLDFIAAQESALRDSLHTSVCEAAGAHVRKTFAEGGDKMRAAAFASAMDALAGKATDSDAVGDAFTSYLKSVSEGIAAAKTNEVTLPADVVASIQDDMDALLRREGLDMEVKAPTSAVLGEI